jgi:two-component system NarL family sensor kinase
MKKRIHLIPFCLIILLINSAIYSQNHVTDSLKSLLRTQKDDSSKAITLNLLSAQLQELGKYDSSLTCANDALALSEKLDFKKGTALALSNTGLVYQDQGNYSKALQYHLKAYEINQKAGNKISVASNLTNVGNIYEYQGNHTQSLEYLLKALAINREIGNKSNIALDLTNIANIYDGLNKYPEALEYNFNALKAHTETNNKLGIDANLSNIGKVYYELGNISKALEYDHKALVIAKEIDDKIGIAILYDNMGDIYSSQKNYSLSKSYFDSALVLSKNIGIKEVVKDVYAGLANIDSATGNFKAEIEDYKQYVIYRDSLLSEASNQKMLQTEMNFEFEQKQAERDKNEAIAEQQRKKEEIIRNFLIAGASLILLIITAGFIYIIYIRKLRRQQENFSRQLIMNIDDERKRISIDLHDDIGQSLSIIKSKIIRNKEKKPDEVSDLESELGHVIEQTREISKMLYPSSLEKIGLLRYVASLMENTQLATKIECSYEITDNVQSLPINTQAQIARIIQECTNNTIKHSGATGLKISIDEKDNRFTLIYQDNGKGIKAGINSDGIGLRSLRERGKILNGEMNIEEKADKGFYLTLKFNLTS